MSQSPKQAGGIYKTPDKCESNVPNVQCFSQKKDKQNVIVPNVPEFQPGKLHSQQTNANRMSQCPERLKQANDFYKTKDKHKSNVPNVSSKQTFILGKKANKTLLSRMSPESQPIPSQPRFVMEP